MPAFKPPGDCPVCSADVPAGRRSCPHCGATGADGWSEDAGHEAAGIPDDTFDYNEYLKREFGNPTPGVRFDRQTLWWATAIVLLAALTFGYWYF